MDGITTTIIRYEEIGGGGGNGIPFDFRFTAGHTYELGEDLSDADKGCALVLKADNKVYKSTSQSDKRIIGFFGELISERTSINNNHVEKAVNVISIGDSYEWNKEVTKDSNNNIIEEKFIKRFDGIKVCNENGNVEVGDLLCTSNLPGYFMKQNDDIIKNSTAARAMENIVFDSINTKDNVYAVMMCG